MLEVKNLKRIYKSKKGDNIYALNGINLKFPEKGLVFILGKSGSGKSTLLNVLGGLDELDEGEFIINGKSSKDFSPTEKDSYRNTYLGFIFQEYNILNDFTVRENIELALQLQHKKVNEGVVDNILEKVDLKGFGERKPNELSGGQKQRVAIARALVKDPQIIFGDEPTGALDSNTGKQVFDTLKKLSKDKLVIIVSHDREFAENYGDRVIELKDGQVISDITKTSSSEYDYNGILIIGDNTLKIGKGHKLTSEDIELIKATIECNDNDTYITTNDGGIDLSKQHSFLPTNEKEIKESKKSINLISSKFTLFNALRMGAKSLKVKPFRLIMTIFLSTIAFGLFATAITLGMFDLIDAATSTFKEQNITDLIVTKTPKQDKNNYSYRYEVFSSEEIENMKNQTGCNVVEINDVVGYFPYDNKNDIYHVYKPTGAVTLSSLDNTPYRLLAGRLPTSSSECLITYNEYLGYYDFGFENGEKHYSPKTINYNDVINTPLFLSINNVTKNITRMNIVGILDIALGEEYEEYRYLSIYDRSSSEQNNLYNLTTKPSKYSLIYIGEDEKAVSKDREGITRTDFLSEDNQTTYYSMNKLGYYPEHDKILFFDKSQKELGDKDIVVNPLTYINSFALDTNVVRDFEMTFEGAKPSLSSSTDYHFSSLTNRGEIVEHVYKASAYKTAYNLYLDFFNNDLDLFRKENEDYDYSPHVGEVSKGVYDYSSLTNEDKYNVFMTYINHHFLLENKDNADLTSVYYSYYRKAFNDCLESFNNKYPFTLEEFKNLYYRLNRSLALDYSTSNYESFYEEFKNDSFYKIYLGNSVSIYSKVNAMRDILTSSTLSDRDFGRYTAEFNNIRTNYFYEILNQVDASEFNNNDVYLEFKDFVYYDLKTNQDVKSSFNGMYKIVGLDFSIDKDAYGVKESTMDLLQDELDKYSLVAGSKNALVIFDKDYNNASSFFNYYYSLLKKFDKADYGEFKLSQENKTLLQVDYAGTLLESLTEICTISSIGLAFFSMALFYNFISISISNKKREIGILRALGTKRSDVFKIFYSEAFIISSINFVLSTILVFTFAIFLNDRIISIGIPFELMKPGVLIVLILLVVSIVTSVLSSLIPVYRIANKSPIDSIKNR